jgi:heme-degrading monooxygenase HmoA
MIFQHVALDVVPGSEADWEAAFATAVADIATGVGFRGVTLSRCQERPSRYLLMTSWDSVEDSVGFRSTAAHARVFSALGPYWASTGEATHYANVRSG